MMLRLFALVGLLVMTLGPSDARGDEAETQHPPNIVMIFADDLGWGDVSFNGRDDWETPNLDRLGARGTIFRRFYTGAVVCAPSRAVLLTGKYTIHNRVSRNDADLPAEEVTIAEALKPLGYTTALFGKWHHGRPRDGRDTYVHPMDQGFDEFFGFTNAVHAWEQFPEMLWDGREQVPVSGYANDLFTEKGMDFIHRHRDRPFFLYLPYIATHFHIEAPEDEVAKHLGKFPEDDPDEPLNATYAAMVTRMDAGIGRIIDTLDELGLSENTLVVFTSDHGATFEQGNRGTSNFHDSNRPFRGQKRTLWEGGIRVPGIACWPGRIPSGGVSDDLVHMIDLLPTFLAAAGAAPDSSWGVDGVNLLPVWTGEAESPDRTVFWEWRVEGYNQLAAMRGDFKLVITFGGRPELFHVENDPAERRNIIAEHQELAQQLREDLDAWLATEVPD